MGHAFRRSYDCSLFDETRIWLPERRIMFVRCGTTLLVALFTAAIAPPVMAAPKSPVKQILRLDMRRAFLDSISPEFPLQETIQVPIWIPGFDDDDPPYGFAPSCSVPSDANRTALETLREERHSHSAHTTGLDICGGIRRKLPRTRVPAGEGRVDTSLPVI